MLVYQRVLLNIKVVVPILCHRFCSGVSETQLWLLFGQLKDAQPRNARSLAQGGRKSGKSTKNLSVHPVFMDRQIPGIYEQIH